MKALSPCLLLMLCFCLFHCSESQPSPPPNSYTPPAPNPPSAQKQKTSNISPQHLNEDYFRERIINILYQKLRQSRYFVDKQTEFKGQIDIVKPSKFPFEYTYDNDQTLTIITSKFIYTCKDATYGKRKTETAKIRVNLSKDHKLEHARYSIKPYEDWFYFESR
jgi:hypothetical protein